jgi:hypothetical protein
MVIPLIKMDVRVMQVVGLALLGLHAFVKVGVVEIRKVVQQ